MKTVNQKNSFRVWLAAALAGLFIAPAAHASSIVYDLSGVSKAHIDRSENRFATRDAYFKVDWSGAVLTHDTMGTASFSDDLISIDGAITAQVCFYGERCSKTKMRPRDGNSIYIGGGTFEFQDVSFRLDDAQTTSNDDLYALVDPSIGKLRLTSKRIPQKWKPQQKLKGDIHDVLLGIKENEDLGYAFRLFDDEPFGDNLFRISSWIMTTSYLFSGSVRLESLPIEDVFNGDIFACRRGGGECGVVPPVDPPPTEIPEPATMALLSMGLLGAARKRRGAGIPKNENGPLA